MHLSIKVLIVTTISLILISCSSVDFYDVNTSSDADSGFLYYPPKPYLVIEKADKGISTKLISLPDLSRPHRVKHSEGFGTAEMGFEIQNGMIKTFNSKSDSKTSETMTALAGIGTANAAIITANATLAASLATSQKELFFVSAADDYDVLVVQDALSRIDDIKSGLLKASNSLQEKPFVNEIDILLSEINNLQKLKQISYDTQNPDELIQKLESYRKKVEGIVNELSGVNSTLNAYASNPTDFPNSFSYAQTAKGKLSKVIGTLAAFASRSASVVGLYEINFVAGKLKLRKVTLE